MDQSRAIIIVKNPEGLRAAAASARISTQPGTALEIFDRSAGDEKDLKLLNKVLSSGHQSVIEHQTLTIAFNDVSVLAEQFVIECRLASFTVKSRRYVDFSRAGWVCPEGLTGGARAVYDGAMAARFQDYERLQALDIPREDARFVLPYCLRSHFFMTANAREIVALACAMLYGRGKGYPEIESLGRQIKEQFDDLFPGLIDWQSAALRPCAEMPRALPAQRGGEGAAEVFLVDAPADPLMLLDTAIDFTDRMSEGDWRTLVCDARPRELELLNYTFRINHISLACLTHFTRHRMLSLLVPPVQNVLNRGDYVLPESVRAVPEAEEIYRRAFREQMAAACHPDLPSAALPYFALSGHQTDILLTMNARELQHFMKLRTCRRAQWEIRDVAWRMLSLLRKSAPELFSLYGPSCVYGRCPEGRMSCGRPYPSI